MDNSNSPVISFSGADILNGENPVVYGLNMDVLPGQIVYIVGKVGTGKTSIIRTITAENRLLKGKGEVCGYNLRTIREKDIPFLRRRLGVVFQDFQLLMDRTVYDNLRFVLDATGWKDARSISGRIAIARAILNEPEVILADEPTGNLDEETAEEILQLLQSLNASKGAAIVMVTHNRSICGRYPGRVFETRDEACTEIK